MMPCLTDRGQSGSEVGRLSAQPEDREAKDEARWDFVDFPVRDVAEQLTRLDSVGASEPRSKTSASASLVPRLPQELFVRVVPFHCLGCIWSQRDKKDNGNLAPSVRATISQFNAVTNRVITSLLCPFAPGPTTSSPVSSPSSASTFLCPSANSPDSAGASPACRARIIERWISIAQVWEPKSSLSNLTTFVFALEGRSVIFKFDLFFFFLTHKYKTNNI